MDSQLATHSSDRSPASARGDDPPRRPDGTAAEKLPTINGQWWTRRRSPPRSRRWTPTRRSAGRSRPSTPGSDSRSRSRRRARSSSTCPPDRAGGAASSTWTPSCCSRRPTRRATRSRAATGSSSSATPASPSRSRPSATALISGAAIRTPAAGSARWSRCATALDDVECWVSGIRRVDSRDPGQAPEGRVGQRFGLWKLNPLADWDEQASVELHPGARRAVQPPSRPELSVDRMHATAPQPRARARTPAPAAGPAPTGPSAESIRGAAVAA